MTETSKSANALLNVQDLWAKYEDIAMHFNDLLMRLRSQSLAAIAALSTIVGVLAKNEFASIRVSWFVAAMIFVAMGLFWVAVWCIDFLYYNRLLLGSVAALKQLENHSRDGTCDAIRIDMSTLIEAEFSRPLLPADFLAFRGVLLFYGIVMFAIVGGAIFCLAMHWMSDA